MYSLRYEKHSRTFDLLHVIYVNCFIFWGSFCLLAVRNYSTSNMLLFLFRVIGWFSCVVASVWSCCPWRRIQTEEKAKVVTTILGEHIDSISCHASVFKQNDLKKRPNLSYSSYRPGEIKPILHIIIVQFIVFFISSWCISSYSSFHPDAVHPILHIILVQNR